jgi:hypothetical protein
LAIFRPIQSIAFFLLASDAGRMHDPVEDQAAVLKSDFFKLMAKPNILQTDAELSGKKRIRNPARHDRATPKATGGAHAGSPSGTCGLRCCRIGSWP